MQTGQEYKERILTDCFAFLSSHPCPTAALFHYDSLQIYQADDPSVIQSRRKCGPNWNDEL